ncbi:unnamed protein product, partial [Mesorhabditis spiculigera]
MDYSIFSKCVLTIHDPWSGGANKTYQSKDPLAKCNTHYIPATTLRDGKISITKPWKKPIDYCDIRCPFYHWQEGHDDPDAPPSDLPTELTNPRFNAQAKKNKNFRPDIHIILIDSCSSTLARRAIPQTLTFLEQKMGGVFMHHLNRVADNSHPNGFAFLFGKRIYESFRGFLGASDLAAEWSIQKACKTYLDNETMIMHEYAAEGYKTAHLLDWGDVFYYPYCKGYLKQPTDHRYEALNRILGVDKEFEKERLANCMEEWHALLKYHGQFAAGYKNNPKFGLSWLVSLLHGNANMLYHTDDYFLKYFQEHEKTFDNSFVFFMGDHGPRIGPTTGTEMGQREVNNPMLMLMVPKFLRENKELMTNLKAHSTSLLTHFDVYATLQDILKNAHATNYTSFKYEQILNPNPNNGTSILRPRGPFEDRNCQNVPVTGDYCLCEFNKTEKNFVPMGKFAVGLINEYVEQEMLSDLCAPLSLGKIESVSTYNPERATQLYEITFTTAPSSAKYKARIRIDDNDQFIASGHPSSPPERWSLYLAQMPTSHRSYEGKKKPAELPLVTFKQFQKLPLDLWVLVRNALTPADLLCLADADRFFKSEKAADILITFEQFVEMPQDVWLLLMEHFSPIDMLNLAYADDFFKGLITASPKRWASFVEHTSSGYGELDAKTYALSRSRKRWEAERKYLLAYGNEYTYPREVFGDPPFEDGLCRHVPPDGNREMASIDDLYILINNATFDQLGLWRLPGPDKYITAPAVRAHIAMLPIDGPKRDLWPQIAEMQPSCVTVHSSPVCHVGEMRSAIKDIMTLVPGLSKLWVHFGREIAEMDSLVEVKAPTIVAYFCMKKQVGTKYSSYKYVLDTKLLKDFHRIVVPALNTLIDQWERREREIDYITFNAQESPQPGRHYRMWNNFVELHRVDILMLPKELCEKRTDPIRLYDLDRLALIRRGPESHEGLLIGVYGASIVLLACDYNFRR